MKNVSVKGIIIAVFVTLILDAMGAIAGVPLFSDGVSEEAIMAIENQTNFLLYALFIGSFTILIGGYISAIFGSLAPYKNSSIFGCISIFMGLLFADYDPLWFDVFALVTIIPISILGGHIVARKKA